MIRALTEIEARAAVKRGEFDKAILKAAPMVAIVMTQSWCYQWPLMMGFLESVATATGAAVFTLEYDRIAAKAEFMAFKEGVLGNDAIPYCRYYRGGKLVAESNYVPADRFKSLLESGHA